MTPHRSVVGSTGLCWLIHSSAAPSLAPLALSASLAASGGAPLASAHSTLSPSYLHGPAWLRSPPHFRPLPNGPPLAFSLNYKPCLIISCSVYYYGSGWPFCQSLGFRWPYLWLSGSRRPLRSSSGLGWPARYSAGLRWPSCCSAWASAGSSSELECSAVQLAAIPYRVSPGLSSIDAWMYVRATALHRRSPPLSAVLPSEGGRCAVAVTPLPRHPRLCPSWRRLQPPPRCSYARSLCFFWFIVLWTQEVTSALDSSGIHPRTFQDSVA